MTLAVDEVASSLAGAGLVFPVGPVVCNVRTMVPQLAEPLALLYADYELTPFDATDVIPDVDAQLLGTGRRTDGHTKVEFSFGGYPALPSLPIAQAHPLLEWGLNWAIATLLGRDIVIHAAIVERDGRAIVLPGEPGAGKSTLCALLAFSGWRLLSDELTVIGASDTLATPLPRPISLKGRSIEVISSRFADVAMTEPVRDTRKGAIAYARPPRTSVLRASERVPVKTIIFPNYDPDVALSVEDVSASQCLSRLIANTFNVGLLGRDGFETLAKTVASANRLAIRYSDSDALLNWLEQGAL